METRICRLILRNLQFLFFACQALGTRVPFGRTLPPRHDDFRLVYYALPDDVPTALFAGPARFGVELRSVDPVESTVQHVEPLDGCTDISNNDTLAGKIAIVQRGNCQFAEKAFYIQKTGAVGSIVIDYNPGLTSDGFPVFIMGSGSVIETITIPMVFLYSSEGEHLINASRRYPNLLVGISNRIPDSVPRTEELVTEITTTEEPATETPTTKEPFTESNVLQGFSVSAEEQQQQRLEKTDAGQESETKLSTLHIALICAGVLVVLTLLAVSLGCWHRSTRKKSGGSPDEIHFSRLVA